MNIQASTLTPKDETWRLQTNIHRVQQNQIELAERLARLERQHEEERRLKAFWGTPTSFPGLLSGTLQPSSTPNYNFPTEFEDVHVNNAGQIPSFSHYEPHKFGSFSRTNSVRFDDSANSSGGGLPLQSQLSSESPSLSMTERSHSYRSEGRSSLTGFSAHSNQHGNRSSGDSFIPNCTNVASFDEFPGFVPGLCVLGSVPAIVRCWLNTSFKHESLLYAAICSSSSQSYVGKNVLRNLDLLNQVFLDSSSREKIKLLVYFPEAISYPSSSVLAVSQTIQLPYISVEFCVTHDQCDETLNDKSIKIFLGCDVLRMYNADLIFSTNVLVLFDEDRAKFSVPMVRPENESTFKHLKPCTFPHPLLDDKLCINCQSSIKSLNDQQAEGNKSHQNDGLNNLVRGVTDNVDLCDSRQDLHQNSHNGQLSVMNITSINSLLGENGSKLQFSSQEHSNPENVSCLESMVQAKKSNPPPKEKQVLSKCATNWRRLGGFAASSTPSSNSNELPASGALVNTTENNSSVKNNMENCDCANGSNKIRTVLSWTQVSVLGGEGDTKKSIGPSVKFSINDRPFGQSVRILKPKRSVPQNFSKGDENGANLTNGKTRGNASDSIAEELKHSEKIFNEDNSAKFEDRLRDSDLKPRTERKKAPQVNGTANFSDAGCRSSSVDDVNSSNGSHLTSLRRTLTAHYGEAKMSEKGNEQWRHNNSSLSNLTNNDLSGNTTNSSGVSINGILTTIGSRSSNVSKSDNPMGGASAFAWLNSSRGK